MRIAYLTQSYPPMISGAALFARQLAEAMAEHGHHVLVIAASDTGKAYRVAHKNLSVLRLPSTHNPFRVGQRLLLFPHRSLMKALREFEPEVIHAHEPFQMAGVGLEYAKPKHIPVMLTIHQLPWFIASYVPGFTRSYAEKVLWEYARFLAGKFTLVVTPTATISALVARETGVEAHTISCGLNLQTFRPLLPSEDAALIRRRWNVPVGNPLLLHVGRLDTDKHVERIIYAAAETMKRTSAHLVIVGDGILKPTLMRLCRSLGIEQRVHFTGYVSAESGLPEIYRVASLFVTACEIETQGIVLLEAEASGLPIVAVRAGCIPEVVGNGENGYLAEPGDTDSMAEAMRLLVADPRRATAMGQAGLRRVATHRREQTVEAYEQLYGESLEEDSYPPNRDRPGKFWSASPYEMVEGLFASRRVRQTSSKQITE